jgi:hypothetical protein
MLAKKVYELPLSRDYVQAWGIAEAVRELIQNAIDSPAEFEYNWQPNTLRIISRGVRLDASTLVLGRTSKANDDDQIGQFGEGYKLAMLVLTREGKKLSILNGDKWWQPEFRMSRMFGVETLHIVEDDVEPSDMLEFTIGGLTEEEQQAIVDSCLWMQDHMDDKITTDNGDILPSRPGKLYVGGLFICDTDMHFGYNFKPPYVALERDRKTVASWQLKSATKDMWFATGDHDRVAQLIHDELPDVEWAQYSSTEMVKEACYRHFKAHYDGHVIARNQEELEKLVEDGMTVYVGGGAYCENVKESDSYQHDYTPPRIIKPEEHLREWLNMHQAAMLPRAVKAFAALIELSKKWTVKS